MKMQKKKYRQKGKYANIGIVWWWLAFDWSTFYERLIRRKRSSQISLYFDAKSNGESILYPTKNLPSFGIEFSRSSLTLKPYPRRKRFCHKTKTVINIRIAWPTFYPQSMTAVHFSPCVYFMRKRYYYYLFIYLFFN